MSVATLDRAASLNRWRHRPLAEKSLLAGGFLLLALILPPWPGAVLVAGAMLGVTFAGARVPLRLWLTVAALPLGFLATGALVVLVQIDAQGASPNPAGPALALAMVLRAVAAMTCLLFLALTTPAVDLVTGLRRLGVPAEIVDIGLLTYRFIFLLAEQAVAMTTAQRARLGHATRRGWLRSTGMVIAGLLPRAMDRARRMELGLAARGWAGELRVLSPRASASPVVLALILLAQAIVAAAGVAL